jgi:hypothetical protein
MTTSATKFEAEKSSQSSAGIKNEIANNNKAAKYHDEKNHDYTNIRTIKPHEIILMQAETRNRYQMNG